MEAQLVKKVQFWRWAGGAFLALLIVTMIAGWALQYFTKTVPLVLIIVLMVSSGLAIIAGAMHRKNYIEWRVLQGAERKQAAKEWQDKFGQVS